MAENTYLDRAYKLETYDDTRRLYDDWAGKYDDDVTGNGYATPARLARLLAAHLEDRAAPILDFGCGTGLSGVALAAEGFTTVDGCDLSHGMLDQARGRGVYRSLWQNDAALPLGVTPGRYAAITAIGAISHGAAAPEALDTVIEALAPGGLLLFSYNEHTLKDPAYTRKLAEIVAESDGRMDLLEVEQGDHLPGIGLMSRIYVLRRRPVG